MVARSDDTRSRGGLRTVGWAAFVLLTVLGVPMLSYFFGGSPLDRPGFAGGQGDVEAEAFTLGHPFTVTGEMTLPAGEEDGVALVPKTPDPSGPLALMAVLPAEDGGAWVVDMPASGRAGASRARRFDAQGVGVASVEVPPGAALAVTGRDGELWLGFAAMGDDSGEKVRRYGRDGALAGEYDLPPGVFARSLSVTADGELWAQVEEYRMLEEEKASVYDSILVPVAVGADLAQATGQQAAAVAGSFFGEDGLRYVIDSELIPFEGDFAFPASHVEVYDGETLVRSVETPKGWRPFAADAEGRVYCERFPPPSPSDTIAYELQGEPAADQVEVRVFDEQGPWSRIPLQAQRFLSEFPPPVRVRGTAVLAVRADGDGVHLLRLAPVAEPSAGEPAGGDPAPAQLTLIAPTQPASGDPYRARDDAERDLLRLVHAGLVRYDADLAPVPDLAAEIPSPGNGGISADGLTITYAMRTDRVWHDGTPVTAEDVVATWSYLKSPSTVPRASFPGAEYIDSVKARGEQVIVTLTEPFGPAPETLFPFVLPAHLLSTEGAAVNGDLWAHPVGAGPYRIVGWRDGDRWSLEAADESAGVTRIDVVFARGDEALETFRRASTPTVWLRVPERLTLDLARDAVGEVTTTPTGAWRGLVLNSSDPILAEAAVREAIRTAMPHEGWANLLATGETDSAVRPFVRAAAIRVPADRPGDLQAARRILDAAGWRDRDGNGVRERNGVELEVGYSVAIRDGRDEVSFEELELVEKVFGEIGIKAGRQYGAPRFYGGWFANGYLATGQEQMAAGVFPGPMDAGVASLFDPADVPSASDPWGIAVSGTRDPELRELHADARAALDAEERAALSAAILERADELDLAVFARPDTRAIAVLGDVGGFEPAPYPAGTLHNVAAWTLPGSGGGSR